ncbi:MAG: hypothetical protein LBK47_09385 [Prevotellaceae bacterium]|jgi:hypothetical protein|nr:hypothetical protein [Prevotellaceae bacterium]
MNELRVMVKGAARGRLALGIVTAYVKLFPELTYKELKVMFPDIIYPKAPSQFKTIEPLGVFQQLHVVQLLPDRGLTIAHFVKPEEIILLPDGQRICVTRTWNKAAFDTLAETAELYGIQVEQVNEGDAAFQHAGFSLQFFPPFEKLNVESLDEKMKRKPYFKWLLPVLSAFQRRVDGFGFFLKKTGQAIKFKPVQNRYERAKRRLIYTIGIVALLLLLSILFAPKSKIHSSKATVHADSVGLQPVVVKALSTIPVYLQSTDTVLMDYSNAALEKLSEFLVRQKTLKVIAVGYSGGKIEEHVVNEAMQRAGVAVEKLIELGIDSARLLGEGRFVPDTTENAASFMHKVDLTFWESVR